MILYHWTIRKNVNAIMIEGLDPRFSRGKGQYIWLAEREKAIQMLDHISQHQEVSPCKMCLLMVTISRKILKGTGISGTWKVSELIHPSKVTWVPQSVLFDYCPDRIAHTA